MLQKKIVIAGPQYLFALGLSFFEKGDWTCPSHEQLPLPWHSLAPELAAVCLAAPQNFLKCIFLGWTREPDVSFFSFQSCSSEKLRLRKHPVIVNNVQGICSDDSLCYFVYFSTLCVCVCVCGEVFTKKQTPEIVKLALASSLCPRLLPGTYLLSTGSGMRQGI